MEILINGRKADIILEKEQTVGEVLAALEQWLSGPDPGRGYRLSGIVINGEPASTGSLKSFFDRDLSSVQTMDLVTSSVPELIAESLSRLEADTDEYENLGFAEKQDFRARWNESPEARLIEEQLPELFALCEKTFSGESGPRMLRAIAAERLREFRDPPGELARLEPLVAEICGRLEELPLDIQTGKDFRAAETIQIFSNIAEKVFRLFSVLGAAGFTAGEIMAGDVPVADYISEFSAAVKELLAAYEQHDAILAGDLAEYELAPRLRGLFAAMQSSLTAVGA